MRAMCKFGLSLGLALSLCTVASAAPPPADLEARARAIAEEERALAGTPALSVAIFGEGRVLATFSLGEADREAHVAATDETLYPAASVSKILTAALVMREVERGKLSLDAPVNESLADERKVRDSAGAPVPVTLRMLLSHSSGIPVSWAGIQNDPNEPPRTLDDLLAHGLRTVRPSGEKLIYANDAFALAGWLAARAEGVSFDELARVGLFEPLRMSHSSFATPHDAGPKLAAAYGGGGPSRSSDRVPHQTVSGTAPAGALITTASDLARFGLAMLAGGELDGARVLAPESVAEMMRLQARAHPRMTEGFGLGFGVREEPGRKLVWWDGGLAGAASRLALLPEQRVGVAILSNLANNTPVTHSAVRILELLVPPAPLPEVASDSGAADVVGTYALTDILDPKVRYLEWLANARIYDSPTGLLVETPLDRAPVGFVSTGDHTWVVSGRSMFEGAHALLDGDRLYVGFVESHRISVFRSARAFYVYSAVLVVALVGASVWLVIRWLRRRRRARAL